MFFGSSKRGCLSLACASHAGVGEHLACADGGPQDVGDSLSSCRARESYSARVSINVDLVGFPPRISPAPVLMSSVVSFPEVDSSSGLLAMLF